MNVAEDVTDPWPIKNNGARRSRLIKSKIESLSFEEGKHVVKKWILIRKLDGRTDWHHDDMRRERLVFLQQAGAVCSLRFNNMRITERREPDDRARSICRIV